MILKFSLKEFAENGYDRASTNNIVENAGISKGSLFNYFNNKKNLYVYLLDYSLEIIEIMYKEIDTNERDIFKKIGNFSLQKLEIHRKFPYVFDFLASAELEESKEVRDIIDGRISLIYDRGIKKIYENIDYSLFRPDIDIEKAIEILNWTMFGVGEKFIKQIDRFKDSREFGRKVIKEWEVYSNMLRKSFYKQEDI